MWCVVVIYDRDPKYLGYGNRREIRLLVVDEESSFSEELKSYAEICEHEIELRVEFVNNTDDALARIKSWGPTILLVDAHIPDLKSHELVEKCFQGILPVVVTSEHQSPELEDCSIRWGADGYVSKSSNPDDIEELLQRIIELAEPIDLPH